MDDVERIARGDAAKVRGTGSRMIPHRLNQEERKLFEFAKKKVSETPRALGAGAENACWACISGPGGCAMQRYAGSPSAAPVGVAVHASASAGCVPAPFPASHMAGTPQAHGRHKHVHVWQGRHMAGTCTWQAHAHGRYMHMHMHTAGTCTLQASAHGRHMHMAGVCTW